MRKIIVDISFAQIIFLDRSAMTANESLQIRNPSQRDDMCKLSDNTRKNARKIKRAIDCSSLANLLFELATNFFIGTDFYAIRMQLSKSINVSNACFLLLLR